MINVVDLIRRLLKRGPDTYKCTICDTAVSVGMEHKHPCPLEGDRCGFRLCHETGSCQA